MRILFFLIILSTSALIAEPSEVINSEVSFEVDTRFGKSKGNFSKPSFEELDSAAGKAVIAINTSTINTGNGMRDKHLRSDDFFDTEKFHKATLTILSRNGNQLKSILQIKDVKKEYSINFQTKEEGDQITYFGDFTINRKDFKIDYDSLMNPIENEVKIFFKVTMKKIG